MRKAHTIKQWSELRKEVYLKRCPCSLCRSKKKKKRKETRTQRNGDYRPSVSRAKTKSHIFISEAIKQETTGIFFNGHSQRPFAKDWRCSGLDMLLSTEQIGQQERCYHSPFRRVKGTDRNCRIRGEDCDDLTRHWGTVAQMGQRVTEALGQQSRAADSLIAVGRLTPFDGRR